MSSLLAHRPGSGASPGYYGKVPGRADFISAGLPPLLLNCWDEWLGQALAASQERLGAGWQECYRAAPIWRFVLQAGVCGTRTLVGVLMPSIDQVGRCFPLMLAQPVPGEPELGALLAGAAPWFAAAEGRALQALRAGAEPRQLGQPLPTPMPAPGPVAGYGRMLPGPAAGSAGRWLPLPALSALPAVLEGLQAMASAQPGQGPRGLWCTTGGPHLPPGLALTAGLVEPAAFAALLDGDWSRHGWEAARSEPGAAEWDRQS